MRLLSKVALGGGLASAATATWLVAGGVLATSATLVVLDPGAPRAEAKALVPFDSCQNLLDWYVDNAVGDVGPYGWDDIYLAYDQGFARADLSGVAAALSTTPASVPTGSTLSGTNTQESAVDEPDVAKTDGSLVARIVDENELVLVDVTGEGPRVLSRLQLPRTGYGSELLLTGDRVLVTQQAHDLEQPLASSSVSRYGGRSQEFTRVLAFDITDPARPRLVGRDRYDGRLLSARQYGDTVRLVTAAGRPELDWVYPSKGVSPKEATRRNRELVRRTTIESWLPTVSRNGTRGDLLACEEVLHPARYAGTETVVVTTFPASRIAERSAVAVTAGGGIVYSSTDRLYVATTDYDRNVVDMALRRTGPSKVTTSLHAFDLTGDRTAYFGSGDVDGTVRDRWSLDEHEGKLRVAWTQTDRRGRTENGVTVLSERNGDLVPTATVDNLGLNEEVQSVRWFDDLAVVVTFRQVDPLYTIDLSDQDRPRLLGALKIPGFSGYLHPIGEDRVLGLGMSGDEDGLTGGAQAAVFDITDPTDPVRVSQVSFGKETYFPAVDDPRGFTWLPGSGSALTPLSDWRDGQARMLELEISAAGKITSRTAADLNREWQARSLALPDGRVAVLDHHRVRVLPQL